MKKLFAIAAFLLASTAAQAQYTLRIWRTHHPHRSRSWNGFDTRRLRQHRARGRRTTLAQRSGQRPSAQAERRRKRRSIRRRPSNAETHLR